MMNTIFTYFTTLMEMPHKLKPLSIKCSFRICFVSIIQEYHQLINDSDTRLDQVHGMSKHQLYNTVHLILLCPDVYAGKPSELVSPTPARPADQLVSTWLSLRPHVPLTGLACGLAPMIFYQDDHFFSICWIGLWYL